ncbi:MAG TPA: hypothetical protein VFL55_03160 [Acetobacteraceae bacterium]|nr:hypothetical protein [Acetobacteraceae bacterium]
MSVEQMAAQLIASLKALPDDARVMLLMRSPAESPVSADVPVEQAEGVTLEQTVEAPLERTT